MSEPAAHFDLQGTVGIVVPCYNAEKTLPETLQSIAAQPAACLSRVSTVYLADDGSSDATAEIAGAFRIQGVRTELLRNAENLGQWQTLNKAVEKVLQDGCRWVLILHADDVAKEGWLSCMLENMGSCPPRVMSLSSSWDQLMPDGTVVPGEDDPERTLTVIEGSQANVAGTLKKGCWWHISGCAIRTEVFESAGRFDATFPYMSDLEWLMRVLHRGWDVGYIARPLILYRQHEGNVSSRSMRESLDVREGLRLAAKYGGLLTPADLWCWHWRQVKTCLRRVLRSCLRRDLFALRHACIMLGRSWLGMIQVLMLWVPWVRMQHGRHGAP